MPRETAVRIIQEIEKAYPIETLTYNNIGIWHLFRESLHYQLYDLIDSKTKKKNTEVLFDNTKGLRKFISDSYWNWKEKKQEFKTLSVNLDIDRSNFSVDYKPSDFVFFSIAVHRTLKIDDKYFHRCTDSLSPFLSKYGKILRIESDLSSYKAKPAYLPVFDIDFALAKAYYKWNQNRIWRIFIGQEDVDKIEGLIELEIFLKENHPDLLIDKTYFYRRVRRIFGYKCFFDEFFDKVKPKAIFSEIYSHDRMYGAILSAKERGIKTIDIQHGMQGKFHNDYGAFANVPDQGFDLLPNYFWIWTQFDFENINSWAKPVNQFHRPILGGSTYMSIMNKWEDKFSTDSIDGITLPIITFIHQATREVDVKGFRLLVSALKDIQDDYHLIIRLHPVIINQFSEEELKSFLKELKPSNYTIQTVFDIELFQLLKRSEFVVTVSSTVCLEAFSFGTKVVLLDIEGYNYYEEYCDVSMFEYTEDEEELKTIFLNKDSNEVQEVIFIDDEHIYNAIDEILK